MFSAPGTHLPLWQASGTCGVPVQTLWSSHGVPSGAMLVGVQTPLWHTAAEAQVVPAEHCVLSGRLSPAQKMFPDKSCWQRSNFVQGLRSLHPQAFG